MADPLEDIIGDYRGFAAQQRARLADRGIDISAYGLSHLAYRVPEWDQYVRVRGLIERHAVANREAVWNGRPISLIVPTEPLEVLDGKLVALIELIPPVHQRVYKMGLEHLGVVVGDTFDAFVEAHKPVLTGQQFQGPDSTPDPVYILFEDFTHVKFYRLSLRASVEIHDGTFGDGFHHVDHWVPQGLVTATGPNPLPARTEVPAAPRRWQKSADVAGLFAGRPDPGWESDRALIDQSVTNPWERDDEGDS
jgi:predicted metalloenzyme YecM